MPHGYEVKSTHTIEEVFDAIRAGKQGFQGGRLKSNRIQNYFHHGVACVNPNCDIVGTEFRVERHWRGNRRSWHLNLYAFTKHGHKVMMTTDHIIPKSKGGKTSVENSQPLCARCNSRKGDRIIPPDQISEHAGNVKLKKSKRKFGKVKVTDWDKALSWQWLLRAIKNSLVTRRKMHLPKKWVWPSKLKGKKKFAIKRKYIST